MRTTNSKRLRRILHFAGGILIIAGVITFYFISQARCDGLGCVAKLPFIIAAFAAALSGIFVILLSFFLKLNTHPSRRLRIFGKSVIVILAIFLNLIYLQFFIPESVYIRITAIVKSEVICDIPAYSNDACKSALAQVTRNESLCEEVRFDEACYVRMAQMKKDEKLCERLSDRYGPISVNNCYEGMGIVKNKEFCDKITIEEFQPPELIEKVKEQSERCYQKATQINAGDVSICESISYEPQFHALLERRRCFFSAALVLKDSTLCRKIDSTLGGSIDRIICQSVVNN